MESPKMRPSPECCFLGKKITFGQLSIVGPGQLKTCWEWDIRGYNCNWESKSPPQNQYQSSLFFIKDGYLSRTVHI